MAIWIIIGTLLVAACIALTAWVLNARRASRTASQRRARARQLVPEGPAAAGTMLPLAGALAREPFASPTPTNNGKPLATLDASPQAPGPRARTVMTPDGPLTLTAPPFRLRRSIMTRRERTYARFLNHRLPSGYVLASQVRLESLLTPTDPHGYSADEFRTWRMRVRLRAVDFVICALPGWAPVVAVEVSDTPDETITRDDRMTDEALAEVGLPLVRARRTPREDWSLIELHLAPDEMEEEDITLPDEPEAPPPDALPFDQPDYQ